TLNWTIDGEADATMGIFELAAIRVSSGPGPFQIRWTLVTPNVADGQFQLPPVPAPLDTLIGSFDDFFTLEGASALVDVDWGGFGDVITNEGFFPDTFVNNSAPTSGLSSLPSPPAGEDYRYRRSISFGLLGPPPPI
ncbi:MAG: hypothetical protein KJO07_00080, partial [Deltaproteobacteria bacterium]|nr:hypothetical protein [Deltaproteobacteria bacterium]